MLVDGMADVNKRISHVFDFSLYPRFVDFC
jgi:hypothetical protein